MIWEQVWVEEEEEAEKETEEATAAGTGRRYAPVTVMNSNTHSLTQYTLYQRSLFSLRVRER